MTEWFYVTTLGDQSLILGLPWLEKYNPIINWKEKTLEFRSSPEESAKTFIWSLVQHIIDWKEKTLEFQSSPEESAKTFIWSLVQH